MLRPKFLITNSIAADLSRIERARGFLDAARLSEEWIAGMQHRALILEAHHTTHIEGTHLTLDQSEQLLAGERPAGVSADDATEVVNYRQAFDLVADYLGNGDPITEGLIRKFTSAWFVVYVATRRRRENTGWCRTSSRTP